MLGQRQNACLILVLVGAFVVALGGCGGAADANSLRWSVFKQVGARKVNVAGVVDYCTGEPKPYVDKVLRGYSGNHVLITLRLSKVPPDPEECRGMELAIYKTLSFGRPLDQLVLLDSSTDPPTRRWPQK